MNFWFQVVRMIEFHDKYGFIIIHVDEKKCGSWSAGFIGSQMITIYPVFKLEDPEGP